VVISIKLSKIDPQLLWNTNRKLTSPILLPHSDLPQIAPPPGRYSGLKNLEKLFDTRGSRIMPPPGREIYRRLLTPKVDRFIPLVCGPGRDIKYVQISTWHQSATVVISTARPSSHRTCCQLLKTKCDRRNLFITLIVGCVDNSCGRALLTTVVV